MKIKLFSLLAAITTLLVGACKKNNGAGGPGEQTLQHYFSGASQYTLFNHALQRTHLDTLLGGTNPYTVFAVADSAMTQAGFSSAGIDSADLGVLTGILRYHLVPGAIASTDLDLYQETVWTTADSSYLAYLEFNNFGLFYNGIKLVSIDNRLVNGIVQGIQTMAIPPLGDLVTTIAQTPALADFSYVVSLSENVNNAGSFYNSIIPYISGKPNAPITVFLPDNNYFASVGLNNYTAILQSGGGGTSRFMTEGSLFTADFMGENAINTYLGTNGPTGQLWFSKDGDSFADVNGGLYGVTVYGHFHIVRSNIITTNGIIHVIERTN